MTAASTKQFSLLVIVLLHILQCAISFRSSNNWMRLLWVQNTDSHQGAVLPRSGTYKAFTFIQ